MRIHVLRLARKPSFQNGKMHLRVSQDFSLTLLIDTQSTHDQLWLRPIVWEFDYNNQCNAIICYEVMFFAMIIWLCNKKVLGTLLVSCYFWIYDCWQLGVLTNRHRVYKAVGWTVTKRIFICINFCILLVHRILSWIFHANVSIFS